MHGRLILLSAVGLVAAFVCPLVVGASWIFGPTLLTQSPPGLRAMALVPGVAGPLALVAAVALRPVPRAAVALLVGGLGLIVLTATLEALTAGQSAGFEHIFTRGVGPIPGPRALLSISAATTAALTGLALGRRRPEAGRRVAGVAGAAVLALTVAPLWGRPPIALVLEPVPWATAWPVPALVATLTAFGATCTALLLEEWLPATLTRDRVTRLGAGMGLLAVTVLPVGLWVDAAARSPDLLAPTVTLTIKVYGTWAALFALVAGGGLGLLDARGRPGGDDRR